MDNRLSLNESPQKKIWRAICSPYIFAFLSDSDRIQTCNRLIRSQVLYSVELRSHLLIASANIPLTNSVLRTVSWSNICADSKSDFRVVYTLVYTFA